MSYGLAAHGTESSSSILHGNPMVLDPGTDPCPKCGASALAQRYDPVRQARVCMSCGYETWKTEAETAPPKRLPKHY